MRKILIVLGAAAAILFGSTAPAAAVPDPPPDCHKVSQTGDCDMY